MIPRKIQIKNTYHVYPGRDPARRQLQRIPSAGIKGDAGQLKDSVGMSTYQARNIQKNPTISNNIPIIVM